MIRRYASMLMSCNCRCLIDKPTRIGSSSSTLIDHIYSNDKIEPVAAGVLTNANPSDHYGIFTIIPQGLLKKKQILENFEIRDMSKFNVDEFCNHLNFNLGPLFNENSCSVNEVFSRLISIFDEVVDQFAPKRKAFRKEKKTQAETLDHQWIIKINTKQK